MRIPVLLILVLAASGCGSRPSPQPEPAQSTASGGSAPPPAPDSRPVIAAFGDSLTAGFGVDPGKSYPDFLQKELDRRGYHYHVVNAGISGDTTTDALARLSLVTELKPAVVILEFGGNDGLRGLPVTTTRSNLEQLIAGVKGAGATVLLAGMTLPPNYGPDYISSFQRVYVELAAQYKVARIPFLLEGVGGTSYMQADGLHATAEGNRIVAATVMRYLEPLLPRSF